LTSYRKKFDIIADMLNAVSQGAKKTKIMYNANLSYLLLNKYLAKIMEFGFIHLERKRRWYVITDKGVEFLEIHKAYRRSNKHVSKELDDVLEKKKRLEELCNVNGNRGKKKVN